MTWRSAIMMNFDAKKSLHCNSVSLTEGSRLDFKLGESGTRFLPFTRCVYYQEKKIKPRFLC
jgi:hypothetical protein